MSFLFRNEIIKKIFLEKVKIYTNNKRKTDENFTKYILQQRNNIESYHFL